MKKRTWLLYPVTVTILWGVWGALIELPEKAGFPATLGYVVWAIMTIPVTLIGLRIVGWKLDRDRRSIIYGTGAGLLGCSGQLILFQCLRMGPAFIVFPVISLYPVVTIIMSVLILKERATKRGWTGIALSLIAIVLLSYQSPENSLVSGYLWLLLAMLVFVMWGIQAFIMKLVSDNQKKDTMQSESIMFYLMISAVALTPVALVMTDFSIPVNWGFSGLYSAGMIQLLNAAGFLFFAYAIRYGKAIIVVPMMSLAPVVTVILSLTIYQVIPHPVIITGMVTALIAIYLLAE